MTVTSPLTYTKRAHLVDGHIKLSSLLEYLEDNGQVDLETTANG